MWTYYIGDRNKWSQWKELGVLVKTVFEAERSKKLTNILKMRSPKIGFHIYLMSAALIPLISGIVQPQRSPHQYQRSLHYRWNYCAERSPHLRFRKSVKNTCLAAVI